MHVHDHEYAHVHDHEHEYEHTHEYACDSDHVHEGVNVVPSVRHPERPRRDPLG